MAQTSLLKYKIAGKRFFNALKDFFKEIRGVYPYHGNKYHCPVCDTNLKHFNSINFKYLRPLEDNAFVFPVFLLETSNLSDYSCPCCLATDRDRLYALYFKKRIGQGVIPCKLNIIDFAPQHGLSKFLINSPYTNYRSADLFMEGVDDKVDITDLTIYKDNSIDIFICSHVLEHVKQDIKAMNELHRILKPGGWGIVMVPIMLGIEETFEKDTIVSEADRCKYYMQKDHVRLYSKKGFTDKLKETGFKVYEFNAGYFGVENFKKHGIQERSVLYVVEK